MMKQNKRLIIQNVSLFFLLLIGIIFWFLNLNLTGDAAGKGMQIGFSALYGFGILLISSIVITILNTKKIENQSTFIKFLTFIPIAISMYRHYIYFITIKNRIYLLSNNSLYKT